MSITRSVLWLVVGIGLILWGLTYGFTHMCDEDRNSGSAACWNKTLHPDAYWLGGVAALIAIFLGAGLASEHGNRLAHMQRILTPPPPVGDPKAYLLAREPNGRPGLMLVKHPRPESKKPYMWLGDADVRDMGLPVIAEVLYEDDDTKALYEKRNNL